MSVVGGQVARRAGAGATSRAGSPSCSLRALDESERGGLGTARVAQTACTSRGIALCYKLLLRRRRKREKKEGVRPRLAPELLEPLARAGLRKQGQARVRVLLHEAHVVGAGEVLQRHEGAPAQDKVFDNVRQDARDEGEQVGRLLCARERGALQRSSREGTKRRVREGDAPCRRTLRSPCAATEGPSCPRRRAGLGGRRRPATAGTRATGRRPC